MRISDWVSDVCSADLRRDWSAHAASGAKRPAATARPRRKPWPSSTRRRGGSLDAEASHLRPPHEPNHYHWRRIVMIGSNRPFALVLAMTAVLTPLSAKAQHTQHGSTGAVSGSLNEPHATRAYRAAHAKMHGDMDVAFRSEEHTSDLQSRMRLSYAVFCLTKKGNANGRLPSTKADIECT